MKYKLFKTNTFKRSYKRLQLTDNQDQAFIDVVYKLLQNVVLEEKYRDHALKGEYASFRECHVKPDLLLIYKIDGGLLKLVDMGSHSELFD
ncbi:MAG: type II toxin-antitoxin system YafQ family toxin [Deltaproteobacteria bacterium]|nr:type II toxin-antitoxin system YafQ family toxin [Candidatus Tharpella aukensis]